MENSLDTPVAHQVVILAEEVHLLAQVVVRKNHLQVVLLRAAHLVLVLLAQQSIILTHQA